VRINRQVRSGLGLYAVEGVAALREVDEGEGAEVTEGAADEARVAEPDRDGIDVGLGGDHVGGVELTSGQGSVARFLAPCLDPLAKLPGELLAGAHRLGGEFQLERGSLPAQLVRT
jgi:hypothetical protein